MLLLLLLLLLSIRILVIGFICPPTIYFKFITSLLRQLILLQSAIAFLLQSATGIYSSKQSFSSNQVKDQLTYSLLHYLTGHIIQTYLKIRCVSRDPAGSDIVVYHISTARIFCKTNCTPAGCFTSHVEEQLVVAIGPMQHEIAVTSTKHSVIQYINYMEKTRKQDKHKNA